MFIAALFTVSKTWKQPKCSLMDEWIKLLWNIIQPLKNEEILPFVTVWMDLEGTMLSERNQTEKDKYCMISLICGIQKQNQNKTKLIEKEIGLVITRNRGQGDGGMEEGGQNMQTSSYKINKYQGGNVPRDAIVNAAL